MRNEVVPPFGIRFFLEVGRPLEHRGDLPQIPSPQETQRQGFSYLVAAHNPL